MFLQSETFAARLRPMARHDGRGPNDLRTIRFIPHFQKDPAGSVLVEWGNNRVLCSATIEERLPKWMNSSEGRGWLTAEYGMLPGSSSQRIQRERVLRNGRTQEIQRLIGRSLRACINLKEVGQRTIQFDCDVLQGDGGTRVASITGSYLALRLALQKLVERKKLSAVPETKMVAAVSVGRVRGQVIADLDYPEDSTAEVDANIVMNEDGHYLEVQGTAEDGAYTRAELDQLLDVAAIACQQIFELQKAALKEWNL